MNLDVRLPILLRQLRLPTVAANYARFAQEASQTGQRYEEYLLALLNEEVSQRYINRRKRLVREARFPVLRTLDELDFSIIPSLSKTKVLQLADGEYIQQCENIALIGGIGTGKTHVAISLGLCACEQGHKVRFYTAAGLINELLEAQESHSISKLEARLMKYKLIILDEVGFIPFSQKGAQMLFSRGSLIVTSNLGFAEWTEVFGDPRLTSALLDRLTHRCHMVPFNIISTSVHSSSAELEDGMREYRSARLSFTTYSPLHQVLSEIVDTCLYGNKSLTIRNCPPLAAE